MQLNKILKGIEVLDINGSIDSEICDITLDSRKCSTGSLFIAAVGSKSDGHDYIESAIKAGASAVIYQEGEFKGGDATYIKVPDSRKAAGLAASRFYGNPSSKFNLVGVTGTNGKTTTATLLYHLFTSLGYYCGLISTIANYIGEEKFETEYTTPDAIALNKLMALMAERGCEYCFMEVSSHALDQERVYGLQFRGAIFSNLTHDHLDYHNTFLEYLYCKKRLFDNLPKNAFALINLDDKNGEVMVQNCKATVKRYSCRTIADFNCKIVEETIEGMMLAIGNNRFWTQFIGAHNAYNLLAVYATAILLGADRDEVLVKMSLLKAVAGRLEYVRGGNEITAIVDYAHTPDALENVLKTLRSTAKERQLICVFGCGGNRDKSKRPEMGVIATKYADQVIVTSDNPRFEDPDAIINDIRNGLNKAEKAKSLFITDRREAIRTAIMMAPKGAVILVAGKGHENYQIVGGEKHHFDDKEIISETFEQL
jgi:UDP-N-acetylmuramoyl-L-alanyl-D-glutamate--2,6-diaminopimelate ligase